MKRTQTRSQQTAVLADRQTSSLIVPPGRDDVTTDGLEMDEQPEEDPVLQPPLWLFIVGGVEIVWGAITNFFRQGPRSPAFWAGSSPIPSTAMD